LHHLVQERYPRFVDALSDLDDALTLTYLFAALPREFNIKSKVTNTAKSMAAAWGAYCATAGCITKSFISVKGVYLEATIRGTPVRWVLPHSFTQFLPTDVDYRVMTTFFEFYETLLHFVLFKLYNDLGVRYPLPAVDAGSEVKGSTSFILGANLRSLKNALSTSSSGVISNVVSESIEETAQSTESKEKSKSDKKKSRELVKTVGAALKSLVEESDDEDDEKDVDMAGPLKAALESLAQDEARVTLPGGEIDIDDDAVKRRRLFAGLTFFLSREVPRGYLELVCLAFGGKIGWEGPNSPITASDPSITHHIVDRPTLPSSYDSLPKSREFVQPQWLLDCANFMFLLPISNYAVGAALPPHLSPWVDNDEEGYKPAYAEHIERLKNGEAVEAFVDNGANDMAVANSEDEASASDSEDKASDEDEKASGDDDEDEIDEEEAKKRSEKKRERDVSFA
jgi:pescadillo protein